MKIQSRPETPDHIKQDMERVIEGQATRILYLEAMLEKTNNLVDLQQDLIDKQEEMIRSLKTVP